MEGVSYPWNLQFKVYDVFFILSVLFVTLNAFLIKHAQTRYGTANTVIAYYNNFFTLFLFAIAMTVAGARREMAFLSSNMSLLLMAATGAATQALSYIFYYKYLVRLPVYIIKILLLLITVFTMLFTIVVQRQAPTIMHMFGSVLVLGSAFAILYNGRKQPQKTENPCLSQV